MSEFHLAQFHGGLVLDHHKTEVNEQPIKNAAVTQRLLISLRVNRGYEATPIVKVGDEVLKGQCIAQAEHIMASDVHASSSGTVVSITQRPSSAPDAALATVVELATDGKDQWCELTPLNEDNITSENIQNVMKTAGIMGMGGAGFPTYMKYRHVKYKNAHKKVETLIINGAECEPYIACDERLMLEKAFEVVKGSALMMQAAAAVQTIIAIEDSMGGVRSALEAAINELNVEHFSVVKVPSIYPTGGEKQLIEVLTGKQVPAGETPLALGLLMQNVATAKALHDAVYLGQPLIERVISVTGDQVTAPCNYLARIGTPMKDLLTDAGAKNMQQSRLIVGGPMMGFAMPDDDIGIDKTSNCLLLMKAEKQAMPDNDMPCIRCGDCVKVCPQDLLPQQLFWYINGNEDGNDLEKARDHNLFDCIECGACAYVCPSQIDLVDFYRFGKAELRYLDFKQTQADQAKERFEAREARLIRLKKERQAKRHAKTSQLKDKKVAKKEISDVLARIKQMKDKKEEGQSDE